MIRCRVRLIGLFTIVLVVAFLSSCASNQVARVKDPKRFIREHSLERLPRFDIPIEMNDRVVAWMEYFQGPGRGHFRRYLERSGRYIPLMQEILKKEGMPKDLVYIALIESGFNTQAKSWASAVGPWQFIQSTGRLYGLKISGWEDERRDPYKSTVAAANFFHDLYDQFGDWYLAMAAYNGGPGRVKQAIDITGTKNFWAMADDRRALRPETRDYVPKYIAASIMAKMPERFGFNRVEYKAPFDFDRAQVETQTDLAVIAKCAGVSEEDIADLNPHLTRGTTPPDASNYEIRLPLGSARAFQHQYAMIPRQERVREAPVQVQVARFQTRRGDTIARAARRYGVNAAELAQANGIRNPHRRLAAGMALHMPGSASSRHASREGRESGSLAAARHTVRRGENIAGIARRYGISTKELMAMNHLKHAKALHAGTRLVVREAQIARRDDLTVAKRESPSVGKEHRVSRGETLSMIAKRYGVTTKQLMALNDIKGQKLQAGMKLVIREAHETKVASKASAPVKLAEPSTETEAVSKEELPGEGVAVVEDSTPVAPAKISEAKSTAASGPIKLAALEKGQRASPEPKPKPKKESLHKVGKGENLGIIAKHYGVSVKELMAMNKLKDAKHLRPGAELIVSKGGKELLVKKNPEKEVKVAKMDEPKRTVTATPKKSEAKRADQLSDQLAIGLMADENKSPSLTEAKPDEHHAEQSSEQSPVKLGELKPVKPISSTPKVAYKVRSGDTLWEIARKHKVTIAQIQRWNNLSDPSAVKPGTTIMIQRE